MGEREKAGQWGGGDEEEDEHSDFLKRGGKRIERAASAVAEMPV